MLTMLVYKYVYRSCCLYGNIGVPLRLACVTVMCEGQGSNPILNTFIIQMRGRLCPDYKNYSYVVQLKNKTEKKCYGAKISQRQNVSAPKLSSAKTSALKCRQNVILS